MRQESQGHAGRRLLPLPNNCNTGNACRGMDHAEPIESARVLAQLRLALFWQVIVEICSGACCICRPSAHNFCCNITRLVGTNANHGTSHMQDSKKKQKKQPRSGRTYLTPSLKGPGVREREVLSHPETAEHADRRVQMLHLRLRQLFRSSSPPQDFSLTFIQKMG